MTTFEAGDKIKCTGLRGEYNAPLHWLTVGKIYTVLKAYNAPEYNSGQNGTIKADDGRSVSFNYGSFIKIGDHMSKYDELKDRIEANRKAELGWGKEFDDILREIGENKYITMRACREGGTYRAVEIQTGDRQSLKSWNPSNQCEKNTALHDAALWLLDHSDIKKDEKGDKIRELEATMKDIQRQIKELK